MKMILVPPPLRVFGHSALLSIRYGESFGAFEGGDVVFEVVFEFSIRVSQVDKLMWAL